MDIEEIRAELHHSVEEGDERYLKWLKSLFISYEEEKKKNAADHEFTGKEAGSDPKNPGH